MLLDLETLQLKVAARDSKLSIAQFEEVASALKALYPFIKLVPTFMSSRGDQDLSSSLIEMEKTDFFTRELDEALLNGDVDLAIHSAKDLPEPLPSGLKILALTKGQDARDVLVLREGESLETLPQRPLIGTSSKRREENVRQLIPGSILKPIRGSVPARLELLENGEIDGLITAEAALIRLQLTHLNRLFIEGEVAPLQGRLAIVAKETVHTPWHTYFATLHA